MSLTTVLGITVLEHHRVNRSLRTSANLDFANRNCFDLLVKIIVTAPIARGSSLKSPLDADVVSPLAVLAKIPVRAGKLPRQRAIAQRFRALCRFLGRRHDDANHAHCGRRPRSAKARNRGQWAQTVRRALWGLYERGHCQARFLGPFTFVHSFVRPEEPILSSR